MFHQNFEHTTGPTDGHIWVVTGGDIEKFNGHLPRGIKLRQKESHDMSNRFTGYVPNRCTTIHTDIFKDWLALAEGGMIPRLRSCTEKYIYSRPREGLWHVYQWWNTNLLPSRSSSWSDHRSARIPWFADYNRHPGFRICFLNCVLPTRVLAYNLGSNQNCRPMPFFQKCICRKNRVIDTKKCNSIGIETVQR